jgi:hypothetical protein
VRGEEEEDEGEEHHDFATVLDRPEAPRRVRQEVGEGHLARQNERDGTREQAEDDQDAAEELEHPGETELRRHVLDLPAAKPSEELLRAVLPEHQAGDDAQKGVGDLARGSLEVGTHGALTARGS